MGKPLTITHRRPAEDPPPRPAPLPDFPVVRVPTRLRTLSDFSDWWLDGGVPRGVGFTFLGKKIYFEIPKGGYLIDMPVSALTLSGFASWVESDRFPSTGRVSFLSDRVVIDMSPEELESHNKVKTEVTQTLYNFVREMDLGVFYSDGALLRNTAAGLFHQPDGTFVSWEARRTGRVVLPPRKRKKVGHTEIRGTPDLVVEVVSQDSGEDDAVIKREIYCKAGIPEYWLIDARGGAIDFQLLVRRGNRYAAARPRAGWRRSPVFGRAFRLERERDRVGEWRYTLHVAPA